MKIFLGADHRGFKYKSRIIELLHTELKTLKIKPVDLGAFNDQNPCDYPLTAYAVGKAVAETTNSLGILICMSGNGQTIAANKIKGAYAALCLNKEVASLARQHNNANVLVISAKFTKMKDVKNIVKAFVTAKFEGGRHLRRFNQIKEIEKGMKLSDRH